MGFSENFYGDNYLKTHLPVLTDEVNSKEVNFILNTLNLPEASSVLDIPCGYGRHSVLLAQQGFRVTGIDNNEAFISIAKEKSTGTENIEFFVEDMRNISFEGKFDAVIIISTGFGYFSDAENLALMKAISISLKKGGKLLFESVNRDSLLSKLQTNPLKWILYTDNSTLLAFNKFNIFTGRWLSEQLFVEKDGITRQSMEIRLYTYTEMDVLLRQCGMKITECYGDKMKGDYNQDSEFLIILAEKE